MLTKIIITLIIKLEDYGLPDSVLSASLYDIIESLQPLTELAPWSHGGVGCAEWPAQGEAAPKQGHCDSGACTLKSLRYLAFHKLWRWISHFTTGERNFATGKTAPSKIKVIFSKCVDIHLLANALGDGIAGKVTLERTCSVCYSPAQPPVFSALEEEMLSTPANSVCSTY